MTLSTELIMKRGPYEPGKDKDGIKNKQEKALELYKKATEFHG